MAMPKIIIDDECARRMKEIIREEQAEDLFIRLEAAPG